MNNKLIRNILLENELTQSDDVLFSRAQLLDDPDRLLLEAVLLHRQNAEMVSRLTGITGWWVRRRVRQLVAMMTGVAFVNAMRALPHLPSEDAQIARLRYCQGFKVQEICVRLGINRYQYQRRLDRVRGLIATYSRSGHTVVPAARGRERGTLRLYPQGAFECPTVKTASRGLTA